jgi:hypothetical protein
MRCWKSGLLAGLMLMLWSWPALSAEILSSNEAIDRVVQELLPGGRDAVSLKIWGPLPAGTPLRSTHDLILTTPAPGYSIYIDDHPTANLFHPVRYAFVETSTGALHVMASVYPPANEEQYQRFPTAIGDRLLAVTNRVPNFTPSKPLPPPTRGDRWAVLLNGGFNQSNNHVRYWNDLSNMYTTLVQIYGYADDHIIVLCSDGLNPAPDQSNGQNSNPDLDNDGDADIMYPCVLSNVDMVFAWLTNNLAQDDQLFIFTTDHGSSTGGWNAFQNLWNTESLTDTHFAQLLDNLPEGITIVCTLEPCNSGGFLDNIIVPPGPIVATSACAYYQLSYGTSNLQYDEYAFHWTAAVNGHDAYGQAANADYNTDGTVTMDEAFQYAHSHDMQNEDPQYGEFPIGLGSEVSLWPVEFGSLLLISNQFLDDVGGNNNGAADPGENILLRLTLSNVGFATATGIGGHLSTADSYVLVTQSQAVFPNLTHFQQGVGLPDYLLTISPSCPVGHTVVCNLMVTADSGYAENVVTTFMVGTPQQAPTGPDDYGYRAWDDTDGGPAHPFAWAEAAPQHGGPGTALAWLNADDGTQTVNLPFTFRYYSSNFSQISICTNGWMALGVTTSNDWTNSTIPNVDGPPNMLALFWRDLNAGYGGSQIATYFNPSQHTFTVEYDSVAFYASQTSRQTFQAIFYDPAWYPTTTGDGEILVQYKRVTTAATATFGIENQTQTGGLQYGFNGLWEAHATPVANNRAITYTTNITVATPPVHITMTPVNPPIQIPAPGGNFQYSTQLANLGTSPATFNTWIMQYTPGNVWQGPMLGPLSVTLPGGATISRTRSQNVPGSALSGTYLYRGYVGLYTTNTRWDSSSFTYTKSATGIGPITDNWDNWGEDFEPLLPLASRAELPEINRLEQNYPNPFNPTTVVRYQMPDARHITLKVYDTAGRLVASLVDGWRDAGNHQVTFDGSRLSSGLYFVRMQAGDFSQVRKMMLIR